MPDNTFEKISAWLKYQEEVFGRFQLPPVVNSQDGLPADSKSVRGNEPPNDSETIKVNQSNQASQDIQASEVSESQHRETNQENQTNRPIHVNSEIPDQSLTVQKINQPDRPEKKNIPVANPLKTLQECTDLAALKLLCEQSSVLKTDLAGTNLVFGIGNPHADLMLIGEAPGEREDLQGEPFVGKAGQLLNKILKAIGFDREQVYIANILKHRPPNNRDPLPEERIKSLPFLEKQIDLVNPKLILCLGRISAQTLLETSAPMKDLRGRFHPYRGRYELIVTYHPAALLRNPNWKRGTWEDVQLLRKRYDELGGKP